MSVEQIGHSEASMNLDVEFLDALGEYTENWARQMTEDGAHTTEVPYLDGLPNTEEAWILRQSRRFCTSEPLVDIASTKEREAASEDGEAVVVHSLLERRIGILEKSGKLIVAVCIDRGEEKTPRIHYADTVTRMRQIAGEDSIGSQEGLAHVYDKLREQLVVARTEYMKYHPSNERRMPLIENRRPYTN